MGKIRPSKENKIIVLMSSYFSVNMDQGNYQNRIDKKNGIVYHVGEGEENQKMVRNNKSILESKSKGYRMFYFIKSSQNNIIFKFEVEYDSWAHERQVNSKGNDRQVIVFKLKII